MYSLTLSDERTVSVQHIETADPLLQWRALCDLVPVAEHFGYERGTSVASARRDAFHAKEVDAQFPEALNKCVLGVDVPAGPVTREQPLAAGTAPCSHVSVAKPDVLRATTPTAPGWARGRLRRGTGGDRWAR